MNWVKPEVLFFRLEDLAKSLMFKGNTFNITWLFNLKSADLLLTNNVFKTTWILCF